MVTISVCETKAQRSLFERIPERLHRNDPYFVPPFPGSVAKLFKDNSPYQRFGELIPFVAYRDGEPVGRIVAMINNGHNEYYKDRVAFFGFFDFANDIDVARALLNAAHLALVEKGFTEIRGPYNQTVNAECGLLVDGFGMPPMVMMPYNPPYYVEIYEKLGLVPLRNLLAFRISAQVEAPQRILKICDRVKRTTGLTLRRLNKSKLDDELKICHKLFNETLNRNWGFVPSKLEEWQYGAQDMKAVVDPSLVLFAEKDGVPVGFSICFPDINEFMLNCRSWPEKLRPVKFVWDLLTGRPKQARLAILGVAPEYRGKGVSALFYAETLLTGKKRYTGGEMSWVEENNEEIIKGITLMGGEKYKTYRLYQVPSLQN